MPSASTALVPTDKETALTSRRRKQKCATCGRPRLLVTAARCADCVGMSVAERKVYVRNYQKAKQRAHARLATMYPGVYERLFDEEKDALAAAEEKEAG
jgi:predicted amidophosphoribosyltransferase